MSRKKRSSRKDYQRLSQTGDSDEEIVLYPLSQSNHISLSSDSATTTEFGKSHYDTNQDLELPAALPLPLSNRHGRKRRRRKREEWLSRPLSREAKTCGCFFIILTIVLFSVTVGWWIVMSYAKSHFFTPLPLSSSFLNSFCPTPLPPTFTSSCCNIKPTPSTPPPPPPPPQHSSIAETTTQRLSSTNQPGEIKNSKVISAINGQSVLRTPLPSSPLMPLSSANTLGSPTGHSSHDISTTAPPTTTSHPSLSPSGGGGGGAGGEKRSVSWRKEFFPALTETTPVLQDLSGDGVKDVILVVGKSACLMIVTVLDGLNGGVIWEANVSYDAFAVKCEVDLNKDGILDCIAAGRQSGLRAINGANGSILWDRDPRLAYVLYNFYYPLFIPDQDNDGVVDIIITHGGDSTYRDTDRVRSPGFLTAISGRTGQQLMERILIPDGHETYNSPVLLHRTEEDMILVGSGGETIPGSLWAYSYSSIKQRISTYLETHHNYTNYIVFTEYSNHLCEGDMTRDEMERLRPTMEYGSYDIEGDMENDGHLSNCQEWGNLKPIWNKYSLCVYHLVTATEKGVLLSPVLVDLTGNDQYDLVVSVFEGKTLAINGETAEVIWEFYKPGTESYSVPAPLLFNSDTVPDLLIRSNYGVWNTYNYSVLSILDGRDGTELWSRNSMRSGMISGLSIAATPPGNDAAVFITIGTTTSDTEGPVRREVFEGTREKRHLGSQGEATETDEKMQEEEEEEEKIEEDIARTFTYDFIAEAMAYRDAPGLWADRGASFPDPVTDLTSFLHTYCGLREEDFTAFIYVLPPQNMSASSLYTHGPYVYFPGEMEESTGSKEDEFKEQTSIVNASESTLKRLRCSHIMSPAKVFTTPAISDMNNDGQLEIAYLVTWDGHIEGEDRSFMLPPQFSVFVRTLNDRIVEVMGEEGKEWLSKYLPANQQPWTNYMGPHGDSTYHHPRS